MNHRGVGNRRHHFTRRLERLHNRAALILTALYCLNAVAVRAESPRIVRTTEIARVWSAHPVGFDLLTDGDRQYVAFYDEHRRMSVASRRLDSDRWQTTPLPSTLGWDSHNSVHLAIDRSGALHVSGNMHVHPLVYFRSTQPWDPASLQPVHRMVGSEENRCTYPRFLHGASDELIFTYRDGSSGNGNQIFNALNPDTGTWSRLLDRPLADGEGERNAYFHGPTRGPDGAFHLLWVWRETPDCATNHDLSYARSRDLVHWETSQGKPLELPIRLSTSEIVDAVPVGGGLLNGGERLGFDAAGRPVITYHKFDEKGITQAYTARLEDRRWVIRRASDWDYRWEFQGGGTIVREIVIEAVERAGPGRLQVGFSHPKEGRGRLVLDENTLESIEQLGPGPSPWHASLGRPESSFPGMQVHIITKRVGRQLHVLRWETLGPNRDRPHDPPLPDPSPLRLYEIQSD